MSILLHISDTHFGTEQPEVVRALQQLARERHPDVLVYSGDMTQRARAAQFAAARRLCDDLGIAFLELRETGAGSAFGETDIPCQSPMIRPHFKGPIVLNNNYDLPRAQADLDSGLADAISFGRAFLANPDLVRRLRNGASLNTPRMDTFYTQGPEGYLDYPTLAGIEAVA